MYIDNECRQSVARSDTVGEAVDRAHTKYLAFMLRLWRANDAPDTRENAQWRASLENPHTDERIGFGSLVELFTFLTEEVMHCDAEDDAPTSELKRDV
jgi:hypothetical protein